MNRQRRVANLLIAIALLVPLASMDRGWTGQAQDRPAIPQQQEDAAAVKDARMIETPVPFPRDCDDVTPPGGVPPACCMFGYAYYNDQPVAGASFHIESSQGSLDATTAGGSTSGDPYYSVDLSAAPLLVSPGDVITISASYRGVIRSRTWTVQSGGQHLDLGFGPVTEITWTEKAPMPVPVSTTSYAEVGGQIYIVGGSDVSGATNTLQRYTPATDTWEADTNHGGSLTPLPARRDVMFCGVITGRIHCMGGWDESSNYQGDHFIYDPAANTWSTAESLPEYPIGQFAATVDDKMYVFGGWWGMYQNTVLEYAEGSGWSYKAPMPTARNHGTTGVVDGKIYVIGGQSGQPAQQISLDLVEMYDPATDTWTTGLAPLPTPLGWFSSSGAPVVDGGIYVLGPGATAFAYDPQADVWVTLNSMPNPARGVAALDGAVYAIGSDHTIQGIRSTQADFTAIPLSGVVPLHVQFTNLSTGNIATWNWTFGNGDVSGGRDPAHDYESSGSYDISLTVSGPAGSDIEAKISYITASPNPSPPIAVIDAIWWEQPPFPDPPIQGLHTIHLSGSGYDTDQGGAYITAYRWSSDLDGPLSSAPAFAVEASALAAGDHVISLQVLDNEGVWSLPVNRTLTVLLPPLDVHTFILANRQKLEALYGSAAADQVMARLNELATHERVNGQVMRVEEDGAVAAAYAAWDADPTSTAKANAVTAAIKAVVDAQWTSYPALQYLVIVGDDQVIPFRRVLDKTSYPESHYGLVSPSSTTGAALHDDMTLTDDYYADAMPTVPDSCWYNRDQTYECWDGHDLYVPDLATGRLIETPAEIVAQIDTFLAADDVDTGNAAVTGYGFLMDSALAMCYTLTGSGLAADCTLVGGTWGFDSFVARVLDTRHDVVSINGHADHYTIGTPWGNVDSNDVAAAAADHSRAIFYTPGCHSGLNVPPDNPVQPLDMTQALAQHQVNYVANTGYGWGGSDGIALSERLMLGFTQRLTLGQSAVLGQALAVAKQEYYLTEGVFDYEDEKILIESTLYGLPMYRYTNAAAKGLESEESDQDPPPPKMKEQRVTALGGGLTVNSISYQFPPLTLRTTDHGRYYALGSLVHMGDGEPIQPKYTADLSFPETQAHGVVFKGGTYSDVLSFDPVVDQAITATASLTEPVFSAPGWYPSQPGHFNRLERGDNLVAFLGQFNPQTQAERVYDRLSFDVYYHTGSSDWTGPSIGSMFSHLAAGTATVTVRADDASGIQAVVVTYTGGNGTWHSVDLTQSGNLWTGSFPADVETRFMPQAVDKAGNVAASDDSGRYFRPGDSFGITTIFLPLVVRDH